MKNLIIAQIIFFVFACLHIMPDEAIGAAGQYGSIKLTVVNFKNSNGYAKIGLYNTQEAYLSRGKMKSYESKRVKIRNKKAEVIFKKVPYGEYTIKMFHDVNGNNKLDANVMGIPVEPYAFSNNARGKLGLPKYEQAKFEVNSKVKVMRIEMK